ncbi:indole-3-acetic acid-induced protein ARG2-like [Vigna unguiculata]|uniref:Late embryogenesis abundant protein n=1 Tax=Vigna unguiculata TaxID=3917 RepID=A0A4D6KPK8_VIGUN|nr:indole-3-acetic acid-induced protein ARG2-like [Vigna unguiculata]QCD77577.1 Late embryogenesis abundant protein [Vigna unguiculata]
MARSFANVKTFSALLLDGFSNALTRRGYSVATQSATRGAVTSMAGKSGEEKRVSTYEVSWVPDPVTGYYKPENTNEVDVADLRATLLRKKFNNN